MEVVINGFNFTNGVSFEMYGDTYTVMEVDHGFVECINRSNNDEREVFSFHELELNY